MNASLQSLMIVQPSPAGGAVRHMAVHRLSFSVGHGVVDILDDLILAKMGHGVSSISKLANSAGARTARNCP